MSDRRKDDLAERKGELLELLSAPGAVPGKEHLLKWTWLDELRLRRHLRHLATAPELREYGRIGDRVVPSYRARGCELGHMALPACGCEEVPL
jgi:hypothetical protein